MKQRGAVIADNLNIAKWQQASLDAANQEIVNGLYLDAIEN